MDTRAALNMLLDPDFLGRLYGRPAQVGKLRIKPEVALIASIRSKGGQELGWLRLLWPVSHSKATKAARRAAHYGQSTAITELPGGLLCDRGQVNADPALISHLWQAGEALFAPETDQVLRYNPLRRLVARSGPAVVRVQAGGSVVDPTLQRVLAAAVPTPPLRAHKWAGGNEQGPHVSVVQYLADHDLAAVTRTAPGSPEVLALHQRAGQLLAALHAATGQLGAQSAAALAGHARGGQQAGAAHAQILAHLDAPLAERMGKVAGHRHLELHGQPVLSHGDASPDQVLVEQGGGRLWLTDFDRVCLAPAAKDIGSYLAECPSGAGEHFLAGYGAAGMPLPSQQQVRAATAASLLERAAEPLRTGRANWAAEIHQRLDRIEEVLK
ncbi:MAG: aminoglycoside phosphotransferase family protein [Buchananella hordeovulneris]|nr:aminoglycoside phosphotransferase family protein [Buchananella hordeovulneris]